MCPLLQVCVCVCVAQFSPLALTLTKGQLWQFPLCLNRLLSADKDAANRRGELTSS